MRHRDFENETQRLQPAVERVVANASDSTRKERAAST